MRQFTLLSLSLVLLIIGANHAAGQSCGTYNLPYGTPSGTQCVYSSYCGSGNWCTQETCTDFVNCTGWATGSTSDSYPCGYFNLCWYECPIIGGPSPDVQAAGVRSAAVQPPRQFVPFTAQVTGTYYQHPTGEVVKVVESVSARRADGSRADMWLDGRQRIVLGIHQKQRVSIDPLTESITTYPLSDRSVTSFTHVVPGCTEDANAEHTSLLGYDVVKSVDTKGVYRVENWLAPKLDCLALKSTVLLEVNGSMLPFTVVEAHSIAVGDPDQTLFEIPKSFVERAPSQVLAEHDRRYPGGPKGCDFTKFDQAYQANRKSIAK